MGCRRWEDHNGITALIFETEEKTMEQYVIERDDSPSIKFTGELIGKVSTSPDNGHPDFSGSTGRWTILRLYKTKGGKYVWHKVFRTQWSGEHDVNSAAVCITQAEVVQTLGFDRLAKELYDDCGIDYSEEVE